MEGGREEGGRGKGISGMIYKAERIVYVHAPAFRFSPVPLLISASPS